MSSGNSTRNMKRSVGRAKRRLNQRAARPMLCESLEQRQLLAADLTLTADDGPNGNRSDDGATDLFTIAAQATASTLDVTINGQSAISGDSSSLATLAIRGSSDVDMASVDLSAAVTPTLEIIPTATGALASWDFGGSTVVELTEMETIDATNGLFDLRIRQDLSPDYAADGLEDRIELELADGGARLLIRVNGIDQVKVGGASSIAVVGSSDMDTYAVNETVDGLIAGTIHVGDAANGPGIDGLEINSLSAHDVVYNVGTAGAPKSGIVSIDGSTAIEFQGLAPVDNAGAGGSISVNVVDNAAITM